MAHAVSEPLFVAFGVVFVVGTWAQNVAVIGWISKLCRLYILVWREVWMNLFAWVKDWVQIDFLDYQLDLLTLISTIAMVSGFVPLIVSTVRKSGSDQSTSNEVPEPDTAEMQPKGTYVNITKWLLVASSILFIAFPFFHSFSLAVDVTGDLQNELQAKYADSSQTPDVSWFERAIFSVPGFSSEAISIINYWSVPVLTLALVLAVLMRSKHGLFLVVSSLISTMAAYALAIWYFGSLYGPEMQLVMTNILLCSALGAALGLGLRYSAKSFIYIATFSALVMTADFAITEISRVVDSVERSADAQSLPRVFGA